MMSMPPYTGANLVGLPPTGYSTDAQFLDDLSRQISMSQPRRYSRGSNGHGQYTQHVAGPARVVKPSSSANNSPRSAMMQARRRTLMNDGLLARRNQQLLEQAYLPAPAVEPTADDLMKRSARPVSWHPSSSQLAQHQHQIRLQHQQEQQRPQASPIAQYPFPAYSDLDFYSQYQRQFPPTPAAYSAYDSPTAAFSPLVLPLSTVEPPRYLSADTWTTSSARQFTNAVASPTDCPGLLESTGHYSEPTSTANTTPSDTAAQWSSFVANGFNKGVAPPTPDSYPTVPAPEPVIPSDESIPYQPLEDEEEEGEILIGMGLYDPPEKPLYDATLESYHASVAHILGKPYNYPEPTGKGLKLEDAWEPPVKDDDDDDDDDETNDDDKDADGEEQDETTDDK